MAGDSDMYEKKLASRNHCDSKLSQTKAVITHPET